MTKKKIRFRLTDNEGFFSYGITRDEVKEKIKGSTDGFISVPYSGVNIDINIRHIVTFVETILE